jgi:ArsR family transcriptional regulator
MEVKEMKICFPISKDKGLNSNVYSHFGSAPAFMVADTETGSASLLNNANEQHVHGACNPALALAGADVDAVVVGGIGGGALMKLKSLNKKVFQALPGSIAKNLEAFGKGELAELGSIPSCGHTHDHDHDHRHGHEHGGHCNH